MSKNEEIFEISGPGQQPGGGLSGPMAPFKRDFLYLNHEGVPFQTSLGVKIINITSYYSNKKMTNFTAKI